MPASNRGLQGSPGAACPAAADRISRLAGGEILDRERLHTADLVEPRELLEAGTPRRSPAGSLTPPRLPAPEESAVEASSGPGG